MIMMIVFILQKTACPLPLFPTLIYRDRIDVCIYILTVLYRVIVCLVKITLINYIKYNT